MRGNAPWHCVCVLRAFGAWHFCAVGSKMPNVLIVACVTQGVALGYGLQLDYAEPPPKVHLYKPF